MGHAPRAEPVTSLDVERLERAVHAACAAAFADARRARPGERFYAFGVSTGPGLELAAVANTEEELRRTRPGARWRPREWPRFAAGAAHFAAARHQLERLAETGRTSDGEPGPHLRARTLAACARALRALDAEGHFGEGPARAGVLVAVFTPDAAPEELVALARGLNPPAAVARLAREVKAAPGALGRDERAYSVEGLAVAGGLVAVVVDDAVVAWALADGQERLRLEAARARALALADDLLVLGDERGLLRRLRLSDGAVLPELAGPPSGVAALALSDDARELFVAGRGEELWRLDALRGERRAARRLRAHGLAAGPAGDQVAAATGARALLLDATTLSARAALGRRSDRFGCVAFAPDARVVAAGGRAGEGDAGVVALFDVATGRERGRLVAGDEVACLGWSADGHLLAAGDGSGEARVWAAEGGVEVTRIQGPQQALAGVAFAPAGAGGRAALLTAGRDVGRGAAVRVWPLPPAPPRGRARRPTASRTLRA